MGLFDNLTLFGYNLVKGADKSKKLETFDLEKDASAEVVEQNQMGGAYAYSFEQVSTPTTELESIKAYRNMARNADVDLVLNEIRNEVFIFDVPGKRAIDVSFADETKAVSKAIQKKIHEEYETIYRLMKFREKGVDLFDSWYIDSKLYLHKVVDSTDQKAGIKKIIKIDPLKMRKVKEVPKRDDKGVYDLSKVKEYYIYIDTPDQTSNRQLSGGQRAAGLKIQKDSVVYSDSGIYENGVVQGFLHKAIVPFNNLKLMEESLLIYRVSRAPERRIIYVDVGNLPKNKAEQYVRDLMNRFRNKLVYDSKTGGLADKRNILSMMEDYWLPRREGGKGTEITTLPGGENLGITADVEYFADKLSDALNVPASRFTQQAPSFVFGKGTEINRDEYRFKKFLDRLRSKFITIFEDLLKTQLLLKNIITLEDWDEIRDEIIWIYAEDNSFVEFKESEILNNRIATLATVDAFVGKYFSRQWVLKNVMKMTDKEMDELDESIVEDQKKMAELGIGQDQGEDGSEGGAPEEAGGPQGQAAAPEDQQSGGEQNGGPPFV